MHHITVARIRLLEAFASCVRRFAIAALAAILSVLATQAIGQVRYHYDENGRLVGVVAPDGQSAQYSYDAVGNIISINRLGTATVSISEFTPNEGPVGTNVTIYGAGFKTNPADNTVQFNGTAASVSTASTYSLVVTVPQGASSGPISVSNRNGSASTSTTFTVGALNQAPTISGFTPDIGTVGTVISVTGTNFQTSVPGNKVALGGVSTTVVQDSASPATTLIKVPVPGASSGKISVSTPYGKATSTADFYALPSTVNVADVEFKGRLTLNTPLNVTINSPGKKAVLLFDGPVGQKLHLFTVSGTFASNINAAVYAPSGALIENLILSNQGLVTFASPLPPAVSGGSYTIILSPQPTNTGSISLSVTSDVFGTLAVDGVTPVNLSAGRWGHYSFTAEAGKGYGLGLVGYSVSPAATLFVTLRNASGASLSQCNIYGPGGSCSFAPSLFATAGTYTVDFVPNGPSAVTFNAAFSKDTGSELTVDAPAATPMTIARAGQNGRYTFSGTAGDLVTVVLSNMQGISSTTNVQVYRPSNGASIGIMNVYNGGGGNLNVTLPETGSYTVFVDNFGLDTGSMEVHVKSFATGPLAVDGTTPVNLSVGRTGRYSFTAEAGKGYGLGLVGYTITPGATLFVTLRNASGASLSQCNIYGPGGSCSFAPSLFPSAGTYMIDFVPGGPSAVTFNAAFSKDTGGELTIDAASATTMTIARAGQNGRYTFSGTAGDLVTVVLSNMQGISNTTNVQVYRPSNGASIGIMNVYNGGGGNLNVTLPETGTYTVFVDNFGLDTGSINVHVKSFATGPLAVDGTTSVNLSAGRTGRYSFTAEAGKGYGLGLVGYTITPGATLFVTLRNASGASLSQCNIYGPGGSCSFAPSLFATAGTYTVDFVPNGPSAVTFNAAFSKDTGSELTVDAPTATPMTIARAGQNGRYTFSGTAGDLVTVVLSNMQGISSTTNVQVYRPSNGASIGTMNVYNGGGGALNATLPDTGTYTVFVDNWGLDTGSIDLDVKAGVAIASGNIGGAYAAAMAIDENTSTMWNSGFSAGNTWWGLDFGKSVAITGYTIRARNDGYLNDCPTAWTEEGWNGSSWVAIGTQTTSANWTLGEVRSFTVSSPAAYTKFRLRFTNLQGGVSHSNVAIAEFNR